MNTLDIWEKLGKCHLNDLCGVAAELSKRVFILPTFASVVQYLFLIFGQQLAKSVHLPATVHIRMLN